MNIIPLKDKILVVRINKLNEFNKDGIIVPNFENQKSSEAKVVALGSGKRDFSGSLIPFDVKVGDVVLLNKYSGVELQIEDKQFLLVKEDDILCILNK